jgi:hypothetical protein
LFIGLVANGIVLPLGLLCVGAGLAIFRYWNAIKTFDMWALDEWVHTKMNAIGIREWHSPYHAAEFFCDPKVVKARNDAAAEMNSIMMGLVRDQDRSTHSFSAAVPHSSGGQHARPSPSDSRRHADYEAAQHRHDENNLALARALLRQLAAGTLVAKGLPSESDITRSERIIPASRWRIMGLNIAKAEASGSGFHYIGVVIGKKAAR